MKTLTYYSKMLLLISFVIYSGFNILEAQTEEINYNQVNEELEQTEDQMQGETEFDSVRESADDAFNELDNEMMIMEGEGEIFTEEDSSDSTESMDMVDENTDSTESDSTTTEPEGYDFLQDTQETNYQYTTESDSSQSFIIDELVAEKRTFHNQKIFNDDYSAIVLSRILRRSEYAVANPANIGLKSQTLWQIALPPLGINMGMNIQNSSFSIGTLNEYFNDGRVLSEEELASFTDLFSEGLNFKTSIQMPSLITIRFPIIYGSLFFNTGLLVDENGTLPSGLLGIPFKGIGFDEEIQANDLSFDVGAYVKNTFGYGTTFPLVDGMDMRVGASLSMYAGSFATIDTKELTLLSTQDSILINGEATITMLDFENLEVGEIANVTPGYNIGIGLHAKLSTLLGMSGDLGNDIDVQLSLRDLGASLKSGSMIKKMFTINGSVRDLQDLTDSDVADSLLVQEEVTLDSGYVESYDIAPSMSMMFSYQPASFLLLQGGFSNFLSEGFGYDENPRWNVSASLFPAKWLMLHAGLKTINDEKYYTSGLGFLFKNYEFAVYTHFIGGYGEDIKGVGVNLMSNFYF